MADKHYRHGQFVWRELLTTDPEASTRFYGEVFGWKKQTMPMGGGVDYHMMMVGEQPVGGVMKLPMPGIPPHWGGYVSVADVDATAKLAGSLGAKVVAGPDDVPNMGRFATLIDPQGAAISVWKSVQGDGERAPDARPGLGEFCWEQLNTTSTKAAAEFYTKLLGWAEAPFSGGGDMTVFAAGKAQVASKMEAPAGAPSHWLTYVVVDSLDGAKGRVQRLGGKVLVPLIEVPTVGNIAVIQDNVGAALGIFEMPKASA